MSEHLPSMREELASLKRLLAKLVENDKLHLVPVINEMISDLEDQIARATTLRLVAWTSVSRADQLVLSREGRARSDDLQEAHGPVQLFDNLGY